MIDQGKKSLVYRDLAKTAKVWPRFPAAPHDVLQQYPVSYAQKLTSERRFRRPLGDFCKCLKTNNKNTLIFQWFVQRLA